MLSYYSNVLYNDKILVLKNTVSDSLSPTNPKHHVPIGVQGMVSASLEVDASLIIPGHKVVVSAPVILAKEERAKAKEKAKEKDEDAEEERDGEPLWLCKRKMSSSRTSWSKGAPLC